MAKRQANVIGGVDTHKFTHYAAAIDDHGRLLGHEEFPADKTGYALLLDWMRRFGQIETIGVESSGSFGAGLTRFLRAAGEKVAEVNNPNRQARHMQGKSDRLDAEQIARASLAGEGVGTPKTKSAPIEVIRMLRVARGSAVRARTQAFNSLFGTMIGAPSEVRDELVGLTKRTFVNQCLALEPETEDLLELIDQPERLVIASARLTLRDLARRWKALDRETKDLGRQNPGPGEPRCTPAHRAVRSEHRTGRPVPGDGWRQPRADPKRGCFRTTLRGVPKTGQQRAQEQPPPPEPRR
jgi:transposase